MLIALMKLQALSSSLFHSNHLTLYSSSCYKADGQIDTYTNKNIMDCTHGLTTLNLDKKFTGSTILPSNLPVKKPKNTEKENTHMQTAQAHTQR